MNETGVPSDHFQMGHIGVRPSAEISRREHFYRGLGDHFKVRYFDKSKMIIKNFSILQLTKYRKSIQLMYTCIVRYRYLLSIEDIENPSQYKPLSFQSVI